MTPIRLHGIHHVTAITAEARPNLRDVAPRA
jgi:hypothetical protein